MQVDVWLRTIISKMFKCVHIQYTDEKVDLVLQFIRFGLVGVSNTVISYLLNVAVLLILKPYGLSWDYVAANLVAFFLSVLWSFYWNNKYVFQEKDGQKRNVWKTLLKTYLSYAFTGIVLNNALSYLWIEIVGISKYIAPIINLLISVPLNFIINKKWAFRA